MTIDQAKRDLAVAERQFAEAQTPQQVEVACLRITWARAQLNAVIADARQEVRV